MAYASLVSLSQTIHKLLCDQDRYPISPHENQQIISIQERIISFQAFLEYYSDKASSLEGRIRDAANEAEDIVEYFMWEQIDRQQNRNSESIAEPESSEVPDPSGKYFDFKNLKKVAEEIESIATEVKEIKNSAGTREVRQLANSSSVATSSSRTIIASTRGKSDTEMVGFENELMAVKALLCGESSKLQVIPIFGMGGIGKTTLAKNAFDDQLIVEYFQIRYWVTASQDYSTAQILSSLVVSVGAEGFKGSSESKMAEIVYKTLKGRRYLLVMDDIWCTKAWDDMRRILPDDRNGSRIVLSTRLLDVAAYPNSYSPLHVRLMNAEESWNLLRKKVFQRGDCPPELEDIGKTIARSCRGLPLAIVVIAGLLSNVSQTPASWESIERNVIQAVTANDEQFAERVLSLSYNHLPHHLRPCFLYMGVFPEDYEIRVSELIKLWVAEGFLKLPTGSKNCEEVAEEYLEDLIKRSLVLVTMRKYNGKVKSCGIHDLVRDLCIRKAQQEMFLVHVNYRKALRQSMRTQRRVTLAHSAHLGDIEGVYGSPIHTILCTKKTFFKWNVSMWVCLQYTRLLRVLDVGGKDVRFYRPCQLLSVNKLFHLRYLVLPYQVAIPAAISNLENLQTLIIYPELKSHSEKATVRLKFEVWKMLQLRHLVSSCYFDGLPDPEAMCSPLKNLQTLLQVKNFKCTEEILLMIPNLKKLGICYSADEYVGDYQLQNLQYMHQLEKLTLEVSRSAFVNSEKVKPVFPTTLKKLTLSCCQLPWEDLGILVGSLPNLEVLKLRDYACVGDKWETSEGEFLQLKFLEIDCLDLEDWITESSHFPSLKWLVLRCCFHLEQIPDGIGGIPTLELIEVDDENMLLVGSAKMIQEEQQQNSGDDALQVRVINCFE